jgi:S1-C subfamily serine protease
MGAILLPRLAPVGSQAPVSAQSTTARSSDSACLPSDNPPMVDGTWMGRHRREPYVGIGAALDLETSADGYPRIYRPFDGGPAEAAGVEPGDVIQQVDGVPVQYERADRVAAMIRSGSVGTPVQLTISRSDDSQPMEVTIVRRCIHPPAPFDGSGD